ncbi:hypothetical protein C8A01DRAFT_19577 [Parachaetomium inaequale]|uniref:Uncharacterized protein n=1 Tax=Parachaetomium inaequale TaxID=2588326 RepID=A0AAN6PBT5_9PEZI|nr:hypothetical protein C8A01DRAFT_19577 [Parachaetomium inaequale]
MCLTKVYYNTYSDGAQDITEKAYPCRDGRSCSRPDVRRYDRKFPFGKLGDSQPEPHRSLSERKPTPYFTGHTSRGSKSPSPSGRRDSGVYMSGADASSKHYDYRDPYGGGGYDAYGYHASSRHDPRDRYDRDREREPRLKRSSTAPHIVYMDRERDRDGKSSGSRSRSSSRDIPLGLVPLADEYGRRRRHSSSSSRSRERERGHSTSRDGSDHSLSGLYYTNPTSSSSRRRTDDPHGYVLHNDDDERRRQRREQKRRLSTSSYTEPSTSGMGMGGLGMDTYGTAGAYLPRRASTVVHHSDGSISTGSGGRAEAGSSGRKQLRWEDQVRAQRERQNAEIASRPFPGGEVKGILKHTGDAKGKGREVEDIADLRRAIERMEIPRGRDREPRVRGEWDYAGAGRYGFEDGDGGRRKRSRGYGDGYRY